MSTSERTERNVVTPSNRSSDRRVRALPGGVAAVAVTALLWMMNGTLGLVGGGVLLAAWAVLPATYAFAVGQVAFVAVTRPEALAETGLLIPVFVEVGLVGVLVGPTIRSTRGRRTAGWTLLGTAALGGLALGSYALWDQVWIAATVLVGLGALVAYGLHRYELVVLGKVPDPDGEDLGSDEEGPNSDEEDLDTEGDVDTAEGYQDGDSAGTDGGVTPADDGLNRNDEIDSNHGGEAT